MRQIVAELGSDDLGEMLVLGDSIDFLFREIGEGETVLYRNHGDPRFSNAATR